MRLARSDHRRLAVFGVLGVISVAIVLGLLNAAWCVPALHVALLLATALGTWYLAHDDLALITDGAVIRLVLTGLALGLGLTWLGAGAAALLGAMSGAAWAQGELKQVLDYVLRDTALHWTPLGLVAAFLGTALSIVLNEIGGGAESDPGRQA